MLGLFFKFGRGKTVIKGFPKNCKESNCKRKNISLDKGSEFHTFHNRLMTSWVKDENIEIF